MPLKSHSWPCCLLLKQSGWDVAEPLGCWLVSAGACDSHSRYKARLKSTGFVRSPPAFPLSLMSKIQTWELSSSQVPADTHWCWQDPAWVALRGRTWTKGAGRRRLGIAETLLPSLVVKLKLPLVFPTLTWRNSGSILMLSGRVQISTTV